MIRDQETLNQLVDLVDRFVRERLLPRENELAESGVLPEDILAEMKELGLFGLTIPEEDGGLGLTMEEEIMVAISLGRTSPAFRSIMGTNNVLVQRRLYSMAPKNKNKSIYPSMLAANGSVASV